MIPSFEEKSQAIRARIDPFDEDSTEDTRILWAQSGQRWLCTDEHATAPTWSRIQMAIAQTEPETTKIRVQQAKEERYAQARTQQTEKRDDLILATYMAALFLMLALWLWMLALLPLHWVK